MKFNYKSYSNYLESENERLNTIIDDLEDLNEDYLTENFLLNVKIDKAIEYIKEYILPYYDESTHADFINLLDILGDKE